MERTQCGEYEGTKVECTDEVTFSDSHSHMRRLNGWEGRKSEKWESKGSGEERRTPRKQ